MKPIYLLFFVLCVPFNVFANWYVDYTLFEGSKKLIDNNEFSFNLANVKCTVSENDISKLVDGSYLERRKLTCDLGNNTYISTSAHCTFPTGILLGSASSLQITKDNVLQSVTLQCVSPKIASTREDCSN